jgi:hypothetical protein
MKKSMFPFCLMVLIFLSGCTSTKITSSWSEQDKQVIIKNLKKVLVVALFKDETSRRKAEDEMVSYMNGKGVVSYDYLDKNISTQNEDAIRDKIKADGFDGAITMRLVDVDKQKEYTPRNFSSYPSYYRNFSGYYYHNWAYNSTPGYTTTTTTFTVETNVFSIKEDKIIWTGLTKTTNPEGVEKMTKEITKVVYRKMVQKGFVNEE